MSDPIESPTPRWDPSANCYCGAGEIYPHRHGTGYYCRTGAESLNAAERWVSDYLRRTAAHDSPRWDVAARDVVARVRAQVAEDIAQAIEAMKPSVKQFWDALDARTVYVLNDAAKKAREVGGKPAESVVAALPDVVGTPDRVGRCGDAAPSLVDVLPREFCALPAGHRGWHRGDGGSEWTVRDERSGTDVDESTLPTGTGGEIPRADTKEGGA